jgi:hypothetical protein
LQNVKGVFGLPRPHTPPGTFAQSIVIPFPPGRVLAVRIEPQRDLPGWLVISRSFGWLFGDRAAAERAAEQLAARLGVAITPHRQQNRRTST